VAALRWYGDKVARRTGIPIVVEGEEPELRLDARVENSLFRIAQEALTNVAKHAQASHVTITVESDSDSLRLTIADDGVGFDTQGFADHEEGRGWGLLSISERAEAVGGRCRIVSSPKQGTQITVEIPG
jgi:signal transduction histidine kinase